MDNKKEFLSFVAKMIVSATLDGKTFFDEETVSQDVKDMAEVYRCVERSLPMSTHIEDYYDTLVMLQKMEKRLFNSEY